MKEITFSRESGNIDTYNKATLKYTKMIETEEGRKFFTHLVRAFLQSGECKIVQKVSEPTGITKCDLTHTKLVSSEALEKFKAIYKAKMESFTKLEDESEEMFEVRKLAYVNALRSSNPYACDGIIGYTAPKTDKILCAEALQALIDLKKRIEDNPDEYSEVYKLIQIHPKPATKPTKKFVKREKSAASKSVESAENKEHTYTPKGNTLGDNPAFKKLKAKFK